MSYHQLQRSESPPLPFLPSSSPSTPPRHEEGFDDQTSFPRESRSPNLKGSGLHAALLRSSDDSLDEKMGEYHPGTDLDSFVSHVYEYHQNHGFWCSILKDLSDIFTYIFVVFLILFLSVFIDYDAILQVTADDPVSFWDDVVDVPDGFHPAYIFFCLLGLYAVYRLVLFVIKLRTLLEMKRFYNILQISEEEVQRIPWGIVVARLIKIDGVCVRNPNWTELDVVNRIMRHENFFLGLINRDILDFNLTVLHWVPTGHPNVPYYFATELLGSVISRVIKWCLWENSHQLLPNIKTAQHEEDILRQHANKLSSRFKTAGVIALLLLPFTILYMAVFYILKYGNEFRDNPSSLGFRGWSVVARWRFREFNELPHSFDDRLRKGIKPAKLYLEQFQSHSLNTLGRLLSFIFGSLILAILFLSLWSDNVLSDVEFAPDKAGIWAIGILGAAFAISRSLVFEADVAFDPEKYLLEVSAHTHYMPDSWRNDAAKIRQTKAEFGQFFPDQLTSLLTELGGLVIAPLILIFRLSSDTCARRIVLYYSKYSVSDPTLGDICTYAQFPLKSLGDPNYGAAVSDPHPGDRLKNGKLEQSFVGFYREYPHWQPDEAGEETLGRLADCVVEPSSGDSHPPSRRAARHQQGNVENLLGEELYVGPLDRSIHMSDIQESFFRARQGGGV